MKDYFDLAWNENEPYILLDYDKRLNNSINIKSLINRISKGISSFHTILEFEDDSSLHPQVLQLNYKKPIVQTHTNIKFKAILNHLEDLKSLWNSQSILYDFETDPYLKMYGVVKFGVHRIFNLGLTSVCGKHENCVSPVTLTKAMNQSRKLDCISLGSSNLDDDTFDFSKFLRGKC